MKDMPEDAEMLQVTFSGAEEDPPSGHDVKKNLQTHSNKLHLSNTTENNSMDMTTRDSTVETSFE